MEKKVKLWVRVSGTIEVTEEQLKRMQKENVEWLPEFDNLDFVRDFSDDYAPDPSIDSALEELHKHQQYDCDSETFCNLVTECLDYAKENQESSYYADLEGIDPNDFTKENWQRLISSGVFHDAIGKLIAEEETYILVAEEY